MPYTTREIKSLVLCSSANLAGFTAQLGCGRARAAGEAVGDLRAGREPSLEAQIALDGAKAGGVAPDLAGGYGRGSGHEHGSGYERGSGV